MLAWIAIAPDFFIYLLIFFFFFLPTAISLAQTLPDRGADDKNWILDGLAEPPVSASQLSGMSW